MRPLVEDRLRASGLHIASVSLRELAAGELGGDFFAWKNAFSGVQWPEIWSTYGGWIEATKPELGPMIAANFAKVKSAGRSALAVSSAACLQARAGLHAGLPSDAVLCLPTSPSVAPVREHVDYDRGGTGYLPRTLCLTAVAGLCGLPQLSIPFEVSSGLPAGISLVGAAHADLAVIDAARNHKR